MSKTDIDLGRINEESDCPKFIQIANRIRELIEGGHLALGERLPSINQVIDHFSVSRDTVVKAYQELKNRGIVESSPKKAYFVSNVFMREGLKHVLFLVDEMTPYKEKIYHGMLDGLGDGYYIDLVSHGNSFDLLKLSYEKYRDLDSVVAIVAIPTASQVHDADYFKYVNPGKILFVDRRIEGVAHPAVWQDFSLGFFEALDAERVLLSKYTRLTFLTKYYTNTIIEQMKEGLTRFTEDAGMSFRHLHTMFTEREIRGNVIPEKGDLFIVLDDLLLIELLRACDERNLVPGKDVGIAVVNDGPFFALLPVPVSVLSTDFYRMGELAASFVRDGGLESTRVPTTLTIRSSL
jgi:DNA-binding transcriptional regulator YhcF (GntR family)